MSNLCNNAPCSQLASMRCPICVDEGNSVLISSFCGQECFKICWKLHKRKFHVNRIKSASPKLSSSLSRIDHSCSSISSDENVTGFKAIGKMKGARATLFKTCLYSMYQKILMFEIVADEPLSDSIFNLLSPFHQISLLSDLLIGLLDPNAPLPPDSREHKSAYLEFHITLFRFIEWEINKYATSRGGTPDTMTPTIGQAPTKNNSTPDASPQPLDQTNVELLVDHNLRRRIFKTSKITPTLKRMLPLRNLYEQPLPVADQMDPRLEDYRKPLMGADDPFKWRRMYCEMLQELVDEGRADVLSHPSLNLRLARVAPTSDNIRDWMRSLTIHAKNEKRRVGVEKEEYIDDDEVGEGESEEVGEVRMVRRFKWRKSRAEELTQAYEKLWDDERFEYERRVVCCASVPHFHDLLQPYAAEEGDFWQVARRMTIGVMGHLSREEFDEVEPADESGERQEHEDGEREREGKEEEGEEGGGLRGAESPARTAASRPARISLPKGWTIEGLSIWDVEALDFSSSLLVWAEMIRRISKQGLQISIVGDKPCLEERSLLRTQARCVVANGWVRDWHINMARSGRNYEDFAHCVASVKELPPYRARPAWAGVMPRGQPRTPKEWRREKVRVTALQTGVFCGLSSCVNSLEGAGKVRASASFDWATAPRVKCKACGRCRLVYYCSIACQVEHWAAHKGLCRRAVETLLKKGKSEEWRAEVGEGDGDADGEELDEGENGVEKVEGQEVAMGDM